MKKKNLLPNLLTALGLTCGLFVIFKMSMAGVGQADEKLLRETAGLLLLAGFFDLLDGAIARAIGAESEFGGIFDSMSDAICFGVAPPVIILKGLSVESGTPWSFFITIAAILYSVCGVMRLVRFSVSAKQAKGNEELELANKKNFTGLPIPAAAAAAVSLNLLLFSSEFKEWYHLSEGLRIITLFVALIVLGYFMISRWKFPSLKQLHFRISSFRVIFTTVLLAVLIFYGFLHYFPVIFAGISWSYLLVAWVLSIARMIAGKKAKALQDFEPEPEEDDQDDSI